MRDLCVIYYGQILMTDVVGEFHLEVLVIPLVRILQSSLTILTT